VSLPFTRIAAALAVLVAGAAGAQEIRFATPLSFPISGTPVDLLIADCNDDRDLDLLVTNIDQGSLGVLIGDGAGEFHSLADTPASGAPTLIAGADFDENGTLDLIISETESDFVYLLRGNGNGTFGDPEPIPTDHDPAGVVAVDMNRDGHLDVVVSVSGEVGGRVNVLLGRGDGTFDYDDMRGRRLSGPAFGVRVGHFNDDNHLDVAASVTDGTVAILLGDGTGALGRVTEFPVASETSRLELFDFDGDGNLDVVTADGVAETISVLRGDGMGALGQPTPFATGGGPANVRLADVNRDGIPDAITANPGSSAISVLAGRRDGSFGPPRNFLAAQRPFVADAADVNGDDRLDLIAVSQLEFGGSVDVMLAGADGFNGIEALLPSRNVRGVTARDLDEDGRPDLVVSVADDRAVQMLARDPAGGFLPPQTLLSDVAVGAVELADLNGDARLDIIATVEGQPDVITAIARADGNFAPIVRTELAGPAPSFALADLDRDGRLDFAAQSTLQPAVTILYGNGDGSFTAIAAPEIAGLPGSVVVADFDLDTRLDLAVGNAQRNAITVLLGQDGRRFEAGTPVPTNGAPFILAGADIDGDGNEDLAYSGFSGLRLLFGAGDGSFTNGGAFATGGLTPAVALRDVTGDLRPDLLSVNQISNELLAFANTGSRFTFTGPVRVALGVRPFGLATADVDADGRYDALPLGDAIWVLENAGAAPALRGDGNRDGRVSAADLTAVIRELPPVGSRPIEAILHDGRAGAGADADGDGRLDMLDLAALRTRCFGGS
jgi:hypothetical protein